MNSIQEEKAKITIEVEDTGIGIDSSEQEVIFDSFRQAGEMNKKIKGTGLGLHICRKLCEKMNGQIQVSSKINEGSKFTINIELEYVKDDLSSLINTKIDQIHIICDSEMENKFVTLQFESWLKKVSSYKSFESFIDNLKSGSINDIKENTCIIIDFNLKTINTFNFFKEIKNLISIQTTNILILPLERGFRGLFEEARMMGFDHILSRPITPFKLKKAIENSRDVNK